mmetsp:Transcript_36959/g.86623  ORF Transcript_36959/g.86623 Transcript_36959/m.86623 type:complete len:91 (+) Transcript_36959:892-1164(+)
MRPPGPGCRAWLYTSSSREWVFMGPCALARMSLQHQSLRYCELHLTPLCPTSKLSCPSDNLSFQRLFEGWRACRRHTQGTHQPVMHAFLM